MKSILTCSKCGNQIEITELLNEDLRLLCDSQAAEIEKLEQEILQFKADRRIWIPRIAGTIDAANKTS